ncbi:MAG: polyprenyl synthetase family protein [Pyrinomonadaceae bacterium]
MKAVQKSLLDQLFFSEQRRAIDEEIYRVITAYARNANLRNNLLYHFKIDTYRSPDLEHSKRLRSFLCLMFAEENGFDYKEVLPLAIVVELIHNSTLIIDDIQDNDTSRCGELALWKKVGMPTAVNAGYFLSNLAFGYYNKVLLNRSYFNYCDRVLETLDELFHGQQSDLDFDSHRSIEVYRELAHGKTGALFLLASVFGSMPYAFDNDKFIVLKRFTDAFSEYYQIRDDYSDILSKRDRVDASNIQNALSEQDFSAYVYELEKTVMSAIEELQKISLVRSKTLTRAFDQFRITFN